MEKYQVLLTAIRTIAQLAEAHPGTNVEAIRIARNAIAVAGQVTREDLQVLGREPARMREEEEAQIADMFARPNKLH